MGQYEDARDEAHKAMREVARIRSTIPYGKLVRRIQTWELDPHGETLAQILDDVSREEHRNGRGMLSAVVVHATGDYLPGPGFFKLAISLGYDVSDEVAFHSDELRRVHDSFASSGDR